ncbi:peroxiredoxin family protein [Caldimonas sp. KR1-144]|uniref:peroxiredoxin family protein n=1 Tax=Caldimonas sp. KR1-144 TaxID=3400911 RepID=UPI003C0D2B38
MGTRIQLLARWLAAAGLALAATLAGATVKPSSAAPDFTLRAADGQNLRLQEQRGQVVLLNFWATWCAPCRQEMPHLNRLHEKYRSAGLQLWGVNVDDDPRTAMATAAKLGVRFTVLLDAAKQVVKLYDLEGMPATVLIDRDGRVRYVHRGYREGYEAAYEQQIRELLKE